MEEQSIQLFAAFGLFLLGIAVGMIIQRTARGDGRKISRLQQKLTETEDRFTRYQADVTSHFMDTAKKVQTLNRSYREVHEQLARGARTLCDDSGAEDILSLGLEETSSGPNKGHTINLADNDVAPPMDYAPKATQEAGTLSETYGFQESKLKEFDESLEQDYKKNRA